MASVLLFSSNGVVDMFSIVDVKLDKHKKLNNMCSAYKWLLVKLDEPIHLSLITKIAFTITQLITS